MSGNASPLVLPLYIQDITHTLTAFDTLFPSHSHTLLLSQTYSLVPISTIPTQPHLLFSFLFFSLLIFSLLFLSFSHSLFVYFFYCGCRDY